jgi:hypothetical protein
MVAKPNYLNRHVAIGLLSAGALFTVYFFIMVIAQSLAAAVEQFILLSPLMIPLLAGFGVQVSLFSYARHRAATLHEGTACVSITGGVSTTAMLACCIHHITDVLPLVGFTAAAIFLTAYQPYLIVVGLLSNVVGITFMLNLIQRHRLYEDKGILAGLMRINMAKAKNTALVTSVIIGSFMLGWGILGTVAMSSEQESSNVIMLPKQVSEANGLTVEVTPLPYSVGKELSFNIKMDTHVGDLYWDMLSVAILQDDNGRIYYPKSWNGSPPGGHHRDGILTFPPLDYQPRSIRLILKGLYGVDRVFEWNFVEEMASE